MISGCADMGLDPVGGQDHAGRMLTDDDLPRPTRALLTPPPLERLGVEELRAYVEQLRAEIARAEAEINRKDAVRNAAASFFKS